jgi:hypothetical protein
MKSRSSTGVGQKIDLEYNIETMRITDEDPEGDSSYRPQPSSNDIMSRVKTQSTVTTVNEGVHLEVSPENKKVVAEVGSAKLNGLLAQIKARNSA